MGAFHANVKFWMANQDAKCPSPSIAQPTPRLDLYVKLAQRPIYLGTHVFICKNTQ